ncbi:hypothetical protein BC351_00520 [Paenibacillus ferrarius]|uniref:Uncharacterized protein n=1 Tax=Paenibacillus ferrarius TaxID=1469647 RepID=A0A1V4HS65_9BACL|nr:hypothetical protein [Paenibacillus ferrarius]OPH61760.1 hypothetical protein BC351_00520 [Paenibacillus ferrarius]
MIQHKTPTEEAINAYYAAVEKTNQAWIATCEEINKIVQGQGYASKVECPNDDWIERLEDVGYAMGYDAAYDEMHKAQKNMIHSAMSI